MGSVAPGQALVDVGRILQVLANLISNAAKFSPPDGAVELAASKTGDRLRVLGIGSDSPLPRRAGESDRAYSYRLPRVELYLVGEVY